MTTPTTQTNQKPDEKLTPFLATVFEALLELGAGFILDNHIVVMSAETDQESQEGTQ